MVRLKEAVALSITAQSGNFNSNMVRLKASALGVTALTISFQFQYGTIKRLNHLFVSPSKRDFNSNMVRLKGSYKK